MVKRIGINDKKESQKDYLDDFVPKHPNKPIMVRKSFLVPKEISDKMEDHIRKKRMSGDIYYSQTDLVHEAFRKFLS